MKVLVCLKLQVASVLLSCWLILSVAGVNNVFAQQAADEPGITISSPEQGQQVPVGQLTISGTSTDNPTTDCQVSVDVNDIKPLQNATATGPGGVNDYSTWQFTYTEDYQLIKEGVNELTSKLSCINNPANVTKYYSVNVTGVATPLAAANNTTIAPTSTSNATTKNETQQTTTTMTTMENNETQVSPDIANQTQQQQTPQTKPKPALQPEPSTSSVVQQPLNQTQSQEEEPAVVGEEEEEPTMTNATQ